MILHADMPSLYPNTSGLDSGRISFRLDVQGLFPHCGICKPLELPSSALRHTQLESLLMPWLLCTFAAAVISTAQHATLSKQTPSIKHRPEHHDIGMDGRPGSTPLACDGASVTAWKRTYNP
jgi:hypothetical protein